MGIANNNSLKVSTPHSLGRLVVLRCPWRRPQMVPRTLHSIVRECTIERVSSYILTRPNARSLQSCLRLELLNES